MVVQSPKDLIPHFFDDTAKTYDTVAFWATFGKDNYWKNQILDKIEHADSILDLACGTGILTRKIAAKFPKSKIIGVDISKSYLKIAEKNSASFSNISFMHQDAEKLILDTKFDCVCSSYIPKYCDPIILVKNCISHLKPGGKVILHDFTYPKNNLIKRLWNAYFVLLKIVGVFIPPWKYAFGELPKLVRKSNWVDAYRHEFEKNGLDVQIRYLTCNSSSILIAS